MSSVGFRKPIRAVSGVLLAVLVSGCVDSINQRVAAGYGAADAAAGVASADWTLSDVQLTVPDGLTVSTDPRERIPSDDIVWWGEPGATPAERRDQVAAIIGEAVTRGLTGLGGATAVTAEVELRRFHALTPTARGSCGLLGCLGNINIDLMVTIRDAETGAVLARSGLIEADPEAFQGEAALAAEQRGDTDKVRIIRHVAEVIRAWAGTVS